MQRMVPEISELSYRGALGGLCHQNGLLDKLGWVCRRSAATRLALTLAVDWPTPLHSGLMAGPLLRDLHVCLRPDSDATFRRLKAIGQESVKSWNPPQEK